MDALAEMANAQNIHCTREGQWLHFKRGISVEWKNFGQDGGAYHIRLRGATNMDTLEPTPQAALLAVRGGEIIEGAVELVIKAFEARA